MYTKTSAGCGVLDVIAAAASEAATRGSRVIFIMVGVAMSTNAASVNAAKTARGPSRRDATERARMAAIPLARSVNKGTRRKLKNRGTTYVSVAQNATTVATTP